MKRIISLLITLCSLAAMGQYPVSSISITIANNPPANTADWVTAMPPLMITAQAKLVQGKMDPRVQESRILVTIKNGSNKICGSFTQQTAPLANFNSATKNWSGAVAIGLLGNSCVLQPGTYQLCVQFFSSYAPIEPLSNEVCKSFTIADTKQSTVIAPQNLMPPDGFITPSPNNGQLTLRWTKPQVVPPAPVNSDIMYKVRIIEIKEGQSKTQALQTNTPLDIIEVKNLTQTPYSLHREVDPTGRPSSIVWFVEATNTERVNGQEPKSYGKSEPTTVTFKKSDEDAKLKELKKYTDTTDSAPPKNVLPVDGKNFTQKEARQPMQLRWVQVLPPPPNNDITYTIHIYAVEKGQTPAQAMKNNRPVFEKTVKTKETTWQMPNEYANSKETKTFVWNVRATNKEGKAVGSNDGTSEPTLFRIIITDPGGCMAIDTTKYTVTCKGIDAQGRYIYQINDLILKNISTNPGRTGLFANPATNYIIPNPPTSFSIQNLVPTSANPINAGNQISISFEAHSTSTTLLSFFVDGTIPLGATFCDKHIQVDIDQLPSCICNPCKNKTTTFGNIAATPVVTYQNNGSVSVSSTVTHTPEKVIRVSAQIVDVERLGENGCLRCTKESGEFGNFTGGSLNSNAGNIINGSRGYGKQIQWQTNSPTLINNFSYDLQMMFPPLTEVSCCKDSLRICIRWSFADEKCITCDTLICSVITREYKKTSGPIHISTTPYLSQITKMGEPYVSWYKQENSELPSNFRSQVQLLYKSREEKRENDRYEDFETNMKTTFSVIRNLRTAGVDDIWTTIQNNPLNSKCGGGDFEDHLINTVEWSGGYGVLSTSSNDPSLGSYIAGFTPAANSALDISMSVGVDCNINSNSPVMAHQTAETHHTIASYGNDPKLGALLKTTSSASNLYSFRIGNSCVEFGTEYLSKKFVVSGSGIIKFMYALVMDGPHPVTTNPSFCVKIFDATGTPINNVVYLDPLNSNPRDQIISSSTDPFFQHYTYINYKDWSCATIKLDNYIGQTVSVVLITTDCSQGAHWGYAYIDDWCGDCRGSTTGSVNINAIADSCIKPGIRVCVDYTLPKIGTTTGTGTIKLQFYHGGSPIAYALTSPLLITATGTYCFTIDPSQLPCSNGQVGYDIVAIGNFSIIPVGGSPTPITVTSPDPVGNYQGIKPGFNNDLVCCSTLADDCCTNFVKRVTAQVSMVGNVTIGYNTIKFVPTFTAGPRLIKQVRISVVNVESSSTNKECLTCESNTGRYGTMSVPQSFTGGGKDGIEGMVYPTNPLIATCVGCPPLWNSGHLTHEVIWGSNAGPGYNLMDGAGDQSTTFTVHLPPRSTLSCCDDTIKICIKYSFTDVDCKTCDTIICYKVVNRNTITILSSISPLVIPGNKTGRGIPYHNSDELIRNSLFAINIGTNRKNR